VRIIYDASTMKFDPLLPMLVPLGALIVTLWLYKTASKRLYWKIGAGLTVLLALLVVALPWIDYRHVQAKIASGDVQTAEGIISRHRRWAERRFDGTSKGVGVTSTSRYTTTTYEYFYVGDRFFSYVVNRYPSQVSFTNGSDPPIAITDGMLAKVSYFPDSWNDNDLRIVKLALGPAPASPAAFASLQPKGKPSAPVAPDFAVFRSQFGAAMTKGDATATRAMVHFPFLFGGHDVGADEFDSLWMSLFSAHLRPCLASAPPMLEEGRYVLFCGPYGYYFGRTAEGWKLVEFGADGEAM
jgi:hypothetical protein